LRRQEIRRNILLIQIIENMKKGMNFITKEQITEILNEYGGYVDRSRTEKAIHEDNFELIADAILSKLHQHDVIKNEVAVCPKCKSENMSDATGNIGTCFDCYHLWQNGL
jgi:hypothetical protein